jgi:hypothetical protein
MATNTNQNANAKTGKLNDEEKQLLHECVIEGVDFIHRVMHSREEKIDENKKYYDKEKECMVYAKEIKKYDDDTYNVPLSILQLYADEFAELAKNNKTPMITKLYNECVYNIERLHLIALNIGEEIKVQEKMEKEMEETNDRKLFEELKKKIENSERKIDKIRIKEFIHFSELQITPSRDYEKGFNHFIYKHKKLRDIMKKIKLAIDFD